MTWEDDLEEYAGIKRTEPRAHSQRDIQRLTRQRLGPSWGRKWSKQRGWLRRRLQRPRWLP